MIDAKFLEIDIENVIQKLTTRNQDFSYIINIKKILQERKDLIVNLEQHRKMHNQSSKDCLLYTSPSPRDCS